MSKNKKYDDNEVTNYLRSKGVGFEQATSARTNKAVKTVYIEPGMLGIKGLGKLDFLVNYCNWHLVIRKKYSD